MEVPIQTKDGSIKIMNLNRRKAIRECCLNCAGWFPSEVRDCKDTKCPLHPYRSGYGKQDPKARRKAIREYCLWCSGGKHSEVTKCPVPDCPLFAYRKKRVDKSVKVDSVMEKGHIEVLFQEKKDDSIVFYEEKSFLTIEASIG